MKYEGKTISLDGKKYLEVKYRIQEFRKNPENRLMTEIVFLEDDLAVVKATAVSGKKFLAEAYACRHISVEERFVEMAETAAIGRALSDAGYNLPYEEIVSGIDPLEKCITLDDGSPYLEVPYRIAWMRKCNPDWRIKKTLLKCTRAFAVVQCQIVDMSDQVLSVAHARRQWADSDIGRQFVEYAETAAVGRALSLLGFDLPPEKSKDLNDGRVVSEAPIKNNHEQIIDSLIYQEAQRRQIPDNLVSAAPVQQLQPVPPPVPPVQTASAPPVTPISASTPPVQAVGAPSVTNGPITRPASIPTTFALDNSQPEFDANAFMPVGDEEEVPFFGPNEVEYTQQSLFSTPGNQEPEEDAVIPFGIYTGKMVSEVFKINPEFVHDLAVKYKGNEKIIRVAKAIIVKNGGILSTARS